MRARVPPRGCEFYPRGRHNFSNSSIVFPVTLLKPTMYLRDLLNVLDYWASMTNDPSQNPKHGHTSSINDQELLHCCWG